MKKQLSTLAALSAMLMTQSGCLSLVSRSYAAAVDTRSLGDHWSDGKIRARIRKNYFDDEEMKVLAITPYVYYGKVYLIGEYENPVQRAKALTLAREVDGVKAVTPYLFPKSKDDLCGAADELKIKAEVKSRLIKDKDIWSTNVHVDTVQCHIVLLGLVGSGAEVRKAIAHAKSVAKAREVKSFLQAVAKEEWRGWSPKKSEKEPALEPAR